VASVSVNLLRFRPLAVLIFSLSGALIYAMWARVRFSGDGLVSQYVYVVPIVVPFIAFLFDRAAEICDGRRICFLVDALVIGTAMMRVVSHLPFVSGHALFLTYAILRPGSLVTRVTAAMVMVEVVYLKVFVWGDLVTPLTGTALGLLSAVVVRRITRTEMIEKI